MNPDIQAIKTRAAIHFRDCVKCGMASSIGVMLNESVDFDAFKRRGACDEGVELLKISLVAYFLDQYGPEGVSEILAEHEAKKAKEEADKANKPESPPENN